MKANILNETLTMNQKSLNTDETNPIFWNHKVLIFITCEYEVLHQLALYCCNLVFFVQIWLFKEDWQAFMLFKDHNCLDIDTKMELKLL